MQSTANGDAVENSVADHGACELCQDALIAGLRPLHHRLTEGTHAVADRLDPGDRDATGSERAEKQPDADRLLRLGQGGGTTGWGCPPVARVLYVPIASISTRTPKVSWQRPRAPRIYGTA
jgi:hypothetical protein